MECDFLTEHDVYIGHMRISSLPERVGLVPLEGVETVPLEGVGQVIFCLVFHFGSLCVGPVPPEVVNLVIFL